MNYASRVTIDGLGAFHRLWVVVGWECVGERGVVEVVLGQRMRMMECVVQSFYGIKIPVKTGNDRNGRCYGWWKINVR